MMSQRWWNPRALRVLRRANRHNVSRGELLSDGVPELASLESAATVPYARDDDLTERLVR